MVTVRLGCPLAVILFFILVNERLGRPPAVLLRLKAAIERTPVGSTTATLGEHELLVPISPNRIVIRQPLKDTGLVVKQSLHIFKTVPVLLHPLELWDADPVGCVVDVQKAQVGEARQQTQPAAQTHFETGEVREWVLASR